MRIVSLFITYYGCSLYGFFNPLFGVLFFIHITIFRPEWLVWDNIAFGRLHLVAAVVALLGYLFHPEFQKSSIKRNVRDRNIALFFFFLLWLFIVSFLAEDSTEKSLTKTLDLVKVFGLCFLFCRMTNTAERINAYTWVVSISFGLLGLWGVGQGIAGNIRLDNLYFGGSNYVAALLALATPLAFCKIFDRKLSMMSKCLFGACVVAMVLCNVYSESRGGFLGLIIGLLYSLMKLRAGGRILVALALCGMFALPFVPESYTERIQTIFKSEEQRDQSAQSRLVLWQIAFRIWADHPIAGVGLRNFSAVKEDYAYRVDDLVHDPPMAELIFGQERLPHGLYPGMLAEAGLVGLGLFVAMLLYSILCPFPIARDEMGIDRGLYVQFVGAQAGLVGYAVASVFGDFQYMELLYVQIFFVAAISDYAASVGEVQQRGHTEVR